MAFKATNARKVLPQEMQPHTYAIMYEVEQSHWWYVGRRRIIKSFIEEAIAGLDLSGRRAHILDVGCGTGGNLELLTRFGDTEGVDISEDALAFCRTRGLAKVRHGAAEQLPYEDCSFDLVTALDVVEHLDDDTAGLREMRRVLRPGGVRCCLSRPLCFCGACRMMSVITDGATVCRNCEAWFRPPALKWSA